MQVVTLAAPVIFRLALVRPLLLVLLSAVTAAPVRLVYQRSARNVLLPAGHETGAAAYLCQTSISPLIRRLRRMGSGALTTTPLLFRMSVSPASPASVLRLVSATSCTVLRSPSIVAPEMV